MMIRQESNVQTDDATTIDGATPPTPADRPPCVEPVMRRKGHGEKPRQPRGFGRVYQRAGSSRYWIEYWVRGRQYRESGGLTEREAQKKLTKRLKEIHGDRFVGPQDERLTVETLLDALEVPSRRRERRRFDRSRATSSRSAPPSETRGRSI
jgi:hypothetical protein